MKRVNNTNGTLIRRLKRPFFSCPHNLAQCLNKCVKAKSVRQGKQVHTILIISGSDSNVLSLSSRLVAMYASSGDLRSAKSVFARTPNPNAFAFNWLIFASAFHGHCLEAFGFFSLMRQMGVAPNKFTLSILLKACIGLGDLKRGKEVHCVVTTMGFASDASVGNSMVDLYCKCGCLRYARKVFGRMSVRDVACWTSLICGYFGLGLTTMANKFFKRMKSKGPEPNDFTWNAVIVGYARCDNLKKALEVFKEMRVQYQKVPDSVTWAAIISGLVQSRHVTEALKTFREMLLSGTKPCQATISSLLPICGLTGSIQLGREIHAFGYRTGIETNPFVGSALVDMYSKCGDPKYARKVFDIFRPKTNVALWNSIISCCGKHSMADISLQLFDTMQEEKVRPNAATLVCILSACSHGGLIDRGLTIFNSMRDKHGIEASQEHYSCLIDLLCRSGKVYEAYEVVKEIAPMGHVTESIVGALFHGCKVHGRYDLVKEMVCAGIYLELKRPGGFVTMSNIHASHGNWGAVERVRKVMKERNVHKISGSSWVEKR